MEEDHHENVNQINANLQPFPTSLAPPASSAVAAAENSPSHQIPSSAVAEMAQEAMMDTQQNAPCDASAESPRLHGQQSEKKPCCENCCCRTT